MSEAGNMEDDFHSRIPGGSCLEGDSGFTSTIWESDGAVQEVNIELVRERQEEHPVTSTEYFSMCSPY
jgi:hypothetical protein